MHPRAPSPAKLKKTGWQFRTPLAAGKLWDRGAGQRGSARQLAQAALETGSTPCQSFLGAVCGSRLLRPDGDRRIVVGRGRRLGRQAGDAQGNREAPGGHAHLRLGRRADAGDRRESQWRLALAGSGWVKQDQVVLLDDAAAYYTDLIARSDLCGPSWSATPCARRYVGGRREFATRHQGSFRSNPHSTGHVVLLHATRQGLHAKHDYDAAMADFNEAIRLDPSSLIAYNDRGVTWTSKSDYHKAHQQFNEVLRRAPGNALAFANRGTNWFKQEEYDKALADLDQAIKLDPKQAFAYSNRGRVYMKLGDYPKAMADYDKAIAIAPHEWTAYNGRARILATAPEFEYHLRDGKKAVEVAKLACEYSEWDESIFDGHAGRRLRRSRRFRVGRPMANQGHGNVATSRGPRPAQQRKAPGASTRPASRTTKRWPRNPPPKRRRLKKRVSEPSK